MLVVNLLCYGYIYGEQKGKGPGMMGTSQEGTGVVGISQGGVGIHGETHSTTLAAVMGITLNPESLAAAVYGEQKGKGPGMMGISQEGAGVYGESKSPVVSAVAGTQVNPDSIGAGVYGEHKGKGAGVAGISQEGSGVYGESKSSTVAALVGIQANPYSTGAAIYGEHKGNGQAGYFKGDLLVTGDIKLINADCAEDFNIGTKVFVEPGTVMVLGEEGALFPSDKAYDKRVAGVISGAGDFKPGIVLDKQSSKNNRQPVALLGKVYCKVDAQYGAVEIGDLLTTAPTIGHETSCVSRNLLIKKAMRNKNVCVLSDADFKRAVGVPRDIFDIMLEKIKKK